MEEIKLDSDLLFASINEIARKCDFELMQSINNIQPLNTLENTVENKYNCNNNENIIIDEPLFVGINKIAKDLINLCNDGLCNDGYNKMENNRMEIEIPDICAVNKTQAKPAFKSLLEGTNKKNIIQHIINDINITEYIQCMTFEEVIIKMHEKYSTMSGIGIRTIYDLTAEICNTLSIPIDKVYIIGKNNKLFAKNGLERIETTISLDDIELKVQVITPKIKIKYIDIDNNLNRIMYDKMICNNDKSMNNYKDFELLCKNNGYEIEKCLCKLFA